MGKKNRDRRKDKARARRRRRAHAEGSGQSRRVGHDESAPDDELGSTPAERASTVLHLIADPNYRHHPLFEQGRALLRHMQPPLVEREAETIVDHLVSSQWDRGWQPAELARQARRGCTRAPGARLIVAAIVADHARRNPSALDPRWAIQVDALSPHAVDGRRGWLRTWLEADTPEWETALDAIIDALGNLGALPPLDELLPPPGASTDHRRARYTNRPTEPRAGGATDPMLERIRALLAKAESTDFEAEALAFTTKAQELMTRHAIDQAMVDSAANDSAEGPVAMRLPVDAPYADAKCYLLQVVAEASRCRAVYQSDVDLSTVVGFGSDLSAVEVLYTSLLVQVQRAMAEAAANAPPGTRTRSQAYRSAFLTSYAVRIAERLAEVNRVVVAEAETTHGSSLAPVLASRRDRVDDALDERFGSRLGQFRVRQGFDAAGHVGGRLAADRAQLHFGDIGDIGEARAHGHGRGGGLRA
jgi:hypothetical protein